jgi:nucleoside-diphosphate-sugar epimerase
MVPRSDPPHETTRPDPRTGGEARAPRVVLNPAQARSIRATFTHVSNLLDGVLRLARGDVTPFDRQHFDLGPEEAQEVVALVTAIRERMLEAMTQLGIPLPEVDGSARWRAQTALSFAEIALADLTPGELRGYGSVDDEAARLVPAIASDLQRLVTRAHEILG